MTQLILSLHPVSVFTTSNCVDLLKLLAIHRWCLFPPDTPKELLKPSQSEAWKQKGEAISWFNVIYPKTQSPDWPDKYRMVSYGQIG